MRRSVVASVSLPSEVWKRTREIAKAENKSRSEIVGEALEKYYVAKQWESLQETGSRQAKRLAIRTEEDVDRLVHEYRRNHK